MPYHVDVYLWYYTTDKQLFSAEEKAEDKDVVWKNSKIENPIDFAYHTDIYIIWITMVIKDKPPEKPIEPEKPKELPKPKEKIPKWKFWK